MINYPNPTGAESAERAARCDDLTRSSLTEKDVSVPRLPAPCGQGAASRRTRRPGPGTERRAEHAADGELVSLPEGEQVAIRPIRKADAALRADGFNRLSAQSRWFRFLTVKKVLSPAELRYFTDIDHHNHEALGAFNVADGRVFGVARYIRRADDQLAVDVAVTVADHRHATGSLPSC